MSKADIAVAIIARDAAATIGACLDSIRPYVEQIVVCVDLLTADQTAQVAADHGADLVVPITISEEHECPEHGKVMAQHFARAREQSFSQLDKSHRWLMWIDSDDVLIGGEKMVQHLAEAPAETIGAWLPYEYATVQKEDRSVPSTVFHRERILRSDLPWKWEGRVHETVACGLPGPWTGFADVLIRHQPGGHRPSNSAMRNLLLLEIDLEADPEDRRALFYMGNQYFAMGEWRAAIAYYERLARLGTPNAYELWQAYCYMAMAHMKLNEPERALEAAFAALDTVPDHPEPYYHLASAYAAMGRPEQSMFWNNLSRTMKQPPFFVFKNPLDYSYNVRLLMADVLASMGHVTEARSELEAAHRVLPDEKIGATIERYRNMETAAGLASSFVALAAGKPDAEVVRLWEAIDLPPDAREFGRARDVAIPAYMRSRNGTQPRIIFWCPGALEPWGPPSINGSGIGGSETAVVQIARRFAADGWRVEVFNQAGRYEGVYEGVGYWQSDRLRDDERADVLVSWRKPDAGALPVERRLSLLWCHDLNYGPGVADHLAGWDAVLGVSNWHAGYLRAMYGLSNAGFVPNGIDISRFDTTIRKTPFRCVYASSPDRGLWSLLEAWPRIVEAEPSAELHVCYGWENFDKWVSAGYRHMADLKDRLTRKMAETPGVIWRGRLPQDELAKLYCESYAWLYPCTFLEVSCISAMEAMAGGCVPVTSAVGALPETIAGAGAVVDGYPHSRAWLDFWTQIAIGVLMMPDARQPLRFAGMKRATELTWERAYSEHWKPLVAGLLEGKGKREEVPVC